MHKLKYCPECKSENKFDAVFCQYCKNSFSETQKESTNSIQKVTKNQLKDYKMVLVFIIIILSAVVIISLYSLFM